MSDVTRCDGDSCGREIKRDERRLVVSRVGIWKGNTGEDSDDLEDFCVECCDKNPLLTRWFQELSNDDALKG